MPEFTYETGVKEWRDKQGRLHREDGPAFVAHSVELYYRHGEPLTAEEHKHLRSAETFKAKRSPRGRPSTLAG